jgi:nitroreductase
MTLLEAIDIRVSRRSYKPEPLCDADAGKLRGVLAEHADDARMDLVVGDAKAFSKFFKSYGMFKGVVNYIVLVRNTNDADSEEKLGYYGELAVLHATTLGLGTCWVGGMFDKKALPVALSWNEAVSAVIAVGYLAGQKTLKERLVHSMTHRKTKTSKQMSITDVQPPDWFLSGVSAARKAPSAVNRQPVVFAYFAGKVSASAGEMSVAMMPLDLGIAKLHFALGAGGGEWAWGNGGGFTLTAVKSEAD